MMNRNDENQAEYFTTLIEKSGIEMTAENVLRCIGFAKQAMEKGECSVEAYYRAKQILMGKIECANAWVN